MKVLGEHGQFEVLNSEIVEIARQPYSYMAGMLKQLAEHLSATPELIRDPARQIAIIAEAMTERAHNFIEKGETPQ